MTSPHLYGLILAGGQSSRMGKPKALLQLRDGKSQLEYLHGELSAVCDAVYVSQRKDQHFYSSYPFKTIVDNLPDVHGPLCGILSAMQAHPKADWLIVACDLPNLNREVFNTLITAFKQLKSPNFTAYRSSYDQLPEPLCAIYPAGTTELLLRRANELGKNCPRKLLIVEQAILIEQSNPNALDNLNTPQDLESFLESNSK